MSINNKKKRKIAEDKAIDDAQASEVIKNTFNHVGISGQQISQIWQSDPNDATKRMVYCTDPWGTMIEFYTHSFADTYK